MDSPVDEIAFLTRSENRLRVLQKLRDQPLTRKELRESLDVSRTTLSRSLNDFEDRGMIRRTKQGYATTRAADAVLLKLDPLIATVEGIQNLGEAIDLLPPPTSSLDLRYFRDAEITTHTATNPAEPFDRALELMRGADKYRGLNTTAVPQLVKVVRNGYVEGRIDTEIIVQASFIDSINDAERARPWHDIAETAWVYQEKVPIDMHIINGKVLIWLGERQEDGIRVHGLLETQNSTVLSWAETIYEEYREEAEPLDPDCLPDEPSP